MNVYQNDVKCISWTIFGLFIPATQRADISFHLFFQRNENVGRNAAVVGVRFFSHLLIELGWHPYRRDLVFTAHVYQMYSECVSAFKQVCPRCGTRMIYESMWAPLSGILFGIVAGVAIVYVFLW